MNANWFFPGLSSYVDSERSVPGGYCVYKSDSYQRHPGIYEYVELNTLGVLLTKMRINTRENDQEGQIIPLDWILPPLDGLIKFAYHSFKNSNLWGLVQVNVSFSGLTDSVLRINKDLQYSDLHKQHISLDYSLDLLDKTIDVSALEEVRLLLLEEVASKLLWAFGYDWIDTAFENWWKGIRK